MITETIDQKAQEIEIFWRMGIGATATRAIPRQSVIMEVKPGMNMDEIIIWDEALTGC